MQIFLVGPNAVGKTTLLEAIRLNKAMLAPRTQRERRISLSTLGRIDKVRMQFALVEEAKWKSQFVSRCQETLAQREQEWSSSWITQCNGKQFIRDLYMDCGLTVRPLMLKRRLLQENKYAKEGSGTESWKLLAANLDELLKMVPQDI